jgi:hypothetical protein
MRTAANSRYSSAVGAGSNESHSVTMRGSSICRMKPASTIILYSVFIAPAMAKRYSSSVL